MHRLLNYDPGTDKFFTFDTENVELTVEDVIYFSDHFDQQMFEKITNIHGRCLSVITDVEAPGYDLSVPIIFIPALDMGMLNYIDLFPEEYDSTDTSYCFNFSINKKRPERYCLLKLIEWFNLDSYVHTWSGVGSNFDCTGLISETKKISASWHDQKFFSHLLAPVQTVKENWIMTDLVDQHNGYNRDPGNTKLFMHHFTWLFGQSAVSLITESSTDYQPNFCFSERTMLSIAALTFPIWVGSYGQAQQARIMGFDVFADIINHDYQFKSTVLERCYYAVHDNLQLLTDIQLAAQMRQDHLDRLLNNRDYLMGTGFRGWVHDQIRKLPEDLQPQIFNLMPPINK
jgi:hypothetical protein